MNTRHAGGLLLTFGGGCVLLGIYVGAYLTGFWDAGMILFALPAPVLMAVGLSYTAVWLRQNDIEGRYVLRLGGWFLLGSLLLLLAGGTTVTYQAGQGVILLDQFYLFVNWATGGAFMGLILGLYDIQRKRREVRLTTERERSARLFQRLSVLNRVLRHDIRTGANVIRGYLDLARSDSHETEHALAVIEDRVDGILALGERARELESAIEDEATSVDAVELLEGIVASLEETYPDAEIRTDMPERARVEAGETFTIALREVLENAIEHNDRSPAVVDVSVRDVPGDALEIRIADNGPGVPHQEQRVIEEGRETPLEHSNGLGLWVVQWIVGDAGGDVEIRSNEPRGTVVTLRLPRVEPHTRL